MIPHNLKSPSTTSLVVPAILVTIALSSFKRAFNNDDLPTFGFPIIATLIPSRTILDFSPSLIKLFISLMIDSQIVIVSSRDICSISSYSG